MIGARDLRCPCRRVAEPQLADRLAFARQRDDLLVAGKIRRVPPAQLAGLQQGSLTQAAMLDFVKAVDAEEVVQHDALCAERAGDEGPRPGSVDHAFRDDRALDGSAPQPGDDPTASVTC